MGTFTDFKEIENTFDADFIHINSKKKQVSGRLSVFKFIDKDTLQTICYLPALELTGYGESEEKATEMLKFSVGKYFDYLGSLPAKKRDAELAELGWQPDKLKNKDFSNSYIDISGELKNFNAVEDKVERITIEA